MWDSVCEREKETYTPAHKWHYLAMSHRKHIYIYLIFIFCILRCYCWFLNNWQKKLQNSSSVQCKFWCCNLRCPPSLSLSTLTHTWVERKRGRDAWGARKSLATPKFRSPPLTETQSLHCQTWAPHVGGY